jgi:MFS transporter, PPP family, 3-phenylpropionic acid transporter
MGSGHALAPQQSRTPAPPSSSPPIPWLGLRAAAATVGIALGVYNPFVAVTLSAKGFDVAAIGVVAAIAAIGFVVGTPIWGQLADTRLGRPRALAIASATGGLVLASIWLPVPLPLVAVLFLAGSLFVTAWLSLVDAILVNAVKDSRRYAHLRMISSFTYALAALVGGIIYSSTGFEWSLLLVGAGGLGLAVVARRLPDVGRARVDRASGRGHSWSATATAPVRLLRATPGLPVALLAIALAFLGYMAGNTFMGLYLLELGGSPAAVGLASAISAAIEVPAIFVAGIVAHRYGVRVLFVVAAASATTGVAGWAMAPDVAFVLACRLFAGVGYGGMLVAGVMAVRYFVAPERQATGQGLFQATCFGAAAVVVNVVGGQLHGVIGYRGLFALCAAVGLIGIVIGWRALPGVGGSTTLAAVPLDTEIAA